MSCLLLPAGQVCGGPGLLLCAVCLPLRQPGQPGLQKQRDRDAEQLQPAQAPSCCRQLKGLMQLSCLSDVIVEKGMQQGMPEKALWGLLFVLVCLLFCR
jgi:hypothetical protein